MICINLNPLGDFFLQTQFNASRANFASPSRIETRGYRSQSQRPLFQISGKAAFLLAIMIHNEQV